MNDIYIGSSRSGKKMTKRERKEYLRKLRASYKKGEIIKKKTQEQHIQDMQEAEANLENDLNLL